MNIYLVATSTEYLNILLQRKYPHILISQLNRRFIKEAIKIKDIDLIIDSGAYTAWTKGEKINLDDYIKFCLEVKVRRKNKIYFVNLDIIPGRFGFVPSKRDIEEASIKGWENYVKMKKAGLNVIHIFHQHEDFKWLDKLMKTKDNYIGISPANDISSKKRLAWLKKVFSIVKNKKKTHGFGVTDIKILKQIPFYSVDSSNWNTLARFGVAIYYSKLNTKSITYKNLEGALELGASQKSIRNTSQLRKCLPKIVDSSIRMEKDITKLWQKREIKFS